MSLFCLLKKNKRYREWSIQIMKIAQIIYNYHGIKPDKTLDFYIFKLLSCIKTLFYEGNNSENVLY